MNMILGFNNVDYQLPLYLVEKRQNTCFTAGQFDERIICQQTLALLSQPLPACYFSAVNKRRAEFLAGRIAAADAISRLCGLWHTPGISGSGAPVWPQGLIGSISHSINYVVAVVRRGEQKNVGIGIDLEGIITADQVDLLVNTVLLPDEIEKFVANKSVWAMRINCTLIFSLKESLFKALYPIVGKRFYHAAATVERCSLDGEACLHIVEDLSATIKSGFQVTGYACLYRELVMTMVVPRVGMS